MNLTLYNFKTHQTLIKSRFFLFFFSLENLQIKVIECVHKKQTTSMKKNIYITDLLNLFE